MMLHCGALFMLAIIFGIVVVPIWLLLHYATQWKLAKQMTPDSERSLVELAELADKLQARLDNVERLLDASVPDWRKKP